MLMSNHWPVVRNQSGPFRTDNVPTSNTPLWRFAVDDLANAFSEDILHITHDIPGLFIGTHWYFKDQDTVKQNPIDDEGIDDFLRDILNDVFTISSDDTISVSCLYLLRKTLRSGLLHRFEWYGGE